jgi:hypothetical protein
MPAYSQQHCALLRRYAFGFLLQVKVALCQLHVTADKEQNIASAKAAIEVSA